MKNKIKWNEKIKMKSTVNYLNKKKDVEGARKMISCNMYNICWPWDIHIAV